MTVPTPIQQRIRILDARGVSWRRISKEVGVSRQTVRKYAQLEDCSPEPPARPAAVSKLDPYKPLIGKWLEADRFMPRKQRHTARRVYDRLVEEQGFDGSYQIVQRYVKRWRQEHRLPGDGYPGVGVVAGRDAGGFRFGAGRGGGEPDGRALPGGVVPVFEHAVRGGVARGERGVRAPWGCSRCSSTSAPCRRCWCPDDATGAAHRVSWDRIVVVEVFQRFVAHHRIEVRFCNPGAGNEKGSVENAVGFLRRNVMVPLPNAESHAQPAAVHALQVRPDRRGSPLPQGRAGQGPVRSGSGGDGPDAWNPVRRVPVGGAQGRRRGMRERGLAPLSRGSVVARVDARRRAARVRRGGSAPVTGAGSAGCPAPTAGTPARCGIRRCCCPRWPENRARGERAPYARISPTGSG